MINTPEREDLRQLQKQINAIYDFLHVDPLHHATTRETAIILINKSNRHVAHREFCSDESQGIMDQFLD